MHVLFVENAVGFGGSTVCARRLVRSCAGSGIQASVAVGYAMRGDRVADESWGEGVRVVRMDGWRRHRIGRRLGRSDGFVESRVLANVFEWSTARRLARWMARERVDLVHANNDLLANRIAIAAARMARLPVISHERGWPANTLMSRILRRMVNVRIAISDSVATAIGKTAGASAPVRRVYDGIDVDAYANAADYRQAARQSLGFGDEYVIGFPAVMTAWKGHRCFLDALAGLRRRFPKVRGLVLGSSPGRDASYERSVKRAVDELGLADVVRFAGHVDSMVPMYGAMDLMVHASQQAEPFGLVVVEAMAAGLPVIASKMGGPSEVITHGVNGLLHDPSKPELGRMITTLIDRPHFSTQLAEAGKRRASFFDHARTWRGVVGLYREIHARRHTTMLSADGSAPLLAGGARWP